MLVLEYYRRQVLVADIVEAVCTLVVRTELIQAQAEQSCSTQLPDQLELVDVDRVRLKD